MNDQSVVAIQIDRPLRAEVEVVVRCHLALPVVVSVPPILEDGTPFPTRYWLSCPLAARRVARLESAGGIARLEAFVASSSELRDEMARANAAYATERDAALPIGVDPAPTGGVGGNEGEGLKCLHAHYAHSAAASANPVGAIVAPFVEPLDCAMPCVREVNSQVERNPEWSEPP